MTMMSPSFKVYLFCFSGIYDACQYSWKVYKREDEAWFSRMQEPARSVLKGLATDTSFRTLIISFDFCK